MSLLERVRQAGNDVSSNNVMEAEPGLDLLRAQVQMLVSADDVAAMQIDNPERARNEVRSACRRVFGHPRWSCLSADRRQCLESDLIDTIFGFGPIEGLLDDDTVTEIMVNGPKKLFFEQEGRLCRSAQEFVDDGQLRALIDRVLGPLGRRIDESSPMVNARLPQGHRVHAIIPPLALDGPVLTIRKFTKRVMTLEEMVAKGSFDETMREFLTWAVRARKSIAVSGGTGSGKTTLLNALSCVISSEERIITIEDSAELRFLEHPHVVRLEARPRNAEGCGEVSIRDLVTNALRMRPDRIVVGECRGPEALDMLQAMKTDHPGSMTTVHANDPGNAISRLHTMVGYADGELNREVIMQQIAESLKGGLIVHVERLQDGRRKVTSIVAVDPLPEGGTVIPRAELFSFEREGIDTDGRVVGAWRACGIQPQHIKERMRAVGVWYDPGWFFI